MKTVFKQNQKVYDQINYPDYEGKVLKIYDDSILVLFNGVENYYSLDGSLNDGIPTLSTKSYEVEFKGFEQKAPAPTYEEAVKWVFKNYEDAIDNTVGFYINKEHQEAEKALRKLVIIRDYYNKGYSFEWLKNEYCAVVVEKIEDVYEIAVRYVKNEQRVLFFKSREIANKFLEEQKELLEIAKPLL